MVINYDNDSYCVIGPHLVCLSPSSDELMLHLEKNVPESISSCKQVIPYKSKGMILKPVSFL